MDPPSVTITSTGMSDPYEEAFEYGEHGEIDAQPGSIPPRSPANDQDRLNALLLDDAHGAMEIGDNSHSGYFKV